MMPKAVLWTLSGLGCALFSFLIVSRSVIATPALPDETSAMVIANDFEKMTPMFAGFGHFFQFVGFGSWADMHMVIEKKEQGLRICLELEATRSLLGPTIITPQECKAST